MKGAGSIRAAVVSWKLQDIKRDGQFYGHFHDLVTVAHEEGAQFVVFPENHALELLGLAPDLEEEDVPKFLSQFSEELEKWVGRISASSGMTIVGGSHIKETPDGYKNVSAIGNPDGSVTIVEKNNLTVYEKETWKLTKGKGLVALPKPNLGVLICYDSEFPEAARALCESGVSLLAVPAYTETRRGFQRVRWCSQARAVENQIYVLHASLSGALDREPVPATFGTSAILCPSIEPFPEESILGESTPDEESVILRSLDLDMLSEARERGDVRNWNDRNATSWVIESPTGVPE